MHQSGDMEKYRDQLYSVVCDICALGGSAERGLYCSFQELQRDVDDAQ